MNSINNGLNGRFGAWLKRNLVTIAASIATSVGSPAAGAMIMTYKGKIQAWIDANFTNSFFQESRPTLIIEPTPQEEIILNQFVAKLQVFVTSILFKIDTSFTSALVDVVMVNEQLAKMCIAKEYFSANEKEGLSPNAITLRLQLISEVFAPINEIIIDKLGVYPEIPVSVFANQTDFNALISNSVAGQSYMCKQYLTSNAVSGNPLPFIISPPGSFSPLSPTLPTEPSNSAPGANILLPSKSTKFDPVTESPAVLVVQPQTQPSTVDKTFKYIGFGLLAISAFAAAKSIFQKSKQ